MCGESDIIRRMMLAAHRHGVADPEQNAWITIDMHNSSHYENGGWKRGNQTKWTPHDTYLSVTLIELISFMGIYGH